MLVPPNQAGLNKILDGVLRHGRLLRVNWKPNNSSVGVFAVDGRKVLLILELVVCYARPNTVGQNYDVRVREVVPNACHRFIHNDCVGVDGDGRRGNQDRDL